jgi:2-polyprenyl-3-methyl-5-hydroxy-6-metoxy-1,4-benzoquinol methylase
MGQTTDRIRTDFDTLATHDQEVWSHNAYYHRWLLQQMPAHSQRALDVGCGAGRLTRALAQRAAAVDGVDLSPNMIDVAQARSQAYTNISYQVADVLAWPTDGRRYDVIVSVAVLHHLDLGAALARFAELLNVGGVLAMIDLYQAETLADWATMASAIPIHLALRAWHRVPAYNKAERAAWEVHVAHDHYLTIRHARQAAARLLPNVQVQRRLLWRYSLLWHKH